MSFTPKTRLEKILCGVATTAKTRIEKAVQIAIQTAIQNAGSGSGSSQAEPVVLNATRVVANNGDTEITVQVSPETLYDLAQSGSVVCLSGTSGNGASETYFIGHIGAYKTENNGTVGTYGFSFVDSNGDTFSGAVVSMNGFSDSTQVLLLSPSPIIFLAGTISLGENDAVTQTLNRTAAILYEECTTGKKFKVTANVNDADMEFMIDIVAQKETVSGSTSYQFSTIIGGVQYVSNKLTALETVVFAPA